MTHNQSVQKRVDDFLKKIKPRKTLNKVLLRKVAARLKRLRHESHYDQGTFCEVNDCGTSACIAGYTLIAAGLRPEWLHAVCGVVPPTILISNGNRIASAAQFLLGLTNFQRCDLFDGGGCTWPEPYSSRYAKSFRKSRYDAFTEPAERPSRIAAEMLEAIADGKVTL